ncbi:MAG TPA: hypothetical protein VM915_03070, partial [Verrucomicrobiae bacterium]|nr:hypothetical protein [Verrucomicrobiae bacterium]
MANREEDPEKLFRSIDSLLTSEQFDTARAILETRLREDPKNWELIYREGVALAKQPAEAARRFEAILAMDLDDSLLSAAEKKRRAKAARSSQSQIRYEVVPKLMRTNYITQARIAAGLLSRDAYYGTTTGRAPVWVPPNYGQARMAAMAWLFKFARDQNRLQELEARFKAPIEQPTASPRALWDWLYLSQMEDAPNPVERAEAMQDIARRLAAAGDISGHYLFLSSLRSRHNAPVVANPSGEDNTPPLPAEELDQAVKSYDVIRRWAVAEGHADNYYVMQGGLSLITELRRAKRVADEEHLFSELVSAARDPIQLVYAMQATNADPDSRRVRELFNRWSRLFLDDVKLATGPNASSYKQTAASMLGVRMGKSAALKRDAEVLEMLDEYLDFNREQSVLARSKSTTRSRRPQMGTSAGYTYTQIQIGQRMTQIRIPETTNEFLDIGGITILRYAFEAFKHNDVLSDLQQHLEKRLAAATEADKVYEHLALAHFHQWNEDKDAAVAAMSAASVAAGQDMQLKLHVAG